jgi:Zn finger protein HypA/HybF involved in hydrogenase expression
MSLAEKAAYIRGLAEGLELDTDKKEARVLKEMLELLTEMAGDVDDMGADLTELFDVVEQVDEDLAQVEEEVFGEGADDYSDEMYEITCPNCQQTVQLDEEVLLGGDVICPNCGDKIEIEIDACDCGHEHD